MYQIVELFVGIMIGCVIGGWIMFNSLTVPEVSPTWSEPRNFVPSDIEEMLAARSASSGFLHKTGVVPPRYFMQKTFRERQGKFRVWMDNYASNPGFSHPPTPFPHCQVYINHHYKFIWIKGHKVASTSMRGSLGWLCKDGWKVPEDANWDYCSEPLFKNRNVKEEDVRRWWKDYFVFGVVRNPFTRFSSAHEYIQTLMPKKCTKPSFGETCKDPYLHARICKRENCCRESTTVHHVRHLSDQSTCMFDENYRPAVDFIAQVENLDQDLDTILDTINSRKDPSLPKLKRAPDYSHVNARNKTKEEGGSKKHYAVDLFLDNDECVLSLVKQYQKDFLLLGYLENLF
ncbi:hypothetical protein BSKO_08609 [Bryopsis sp. KO-2023]|nr:hypothetical protein BSKO_08609 [Bryopsis sp. KO-2023]